ncbi:MAG TPA: carbohydrate-binding protein [Candidatus Acidoferrum sp.]|nr:carbohydrate-binding protein [Candidatus Acidoferrum sp.]
MKTKSVILGMVAGGILQFPNVGMAAEFQVATNGADTNPGTKAAPFCTIQRAAGLAQPGDTITVHEGIYRERVNPPRGGTSDKQRITYQAAPGEKVILTGSEVVRGWERVTNDTWRATLPNAFFGKFNPYNDLIHGDWFGANGRRHHTGAVYLNGDWLTEAAHFADVLAPAGKVPLWFGVVAGVVLAEPEPEYLVNVAWLQPGGGARIPAAQSAARRGTQVAECSEGGQCVGFIRKSNWLRYDGVDFGAEAESITLRVAAAPGTGGKVELRLDGAEGELLGTCEVPSTGGWQTWQSLTARITPTGGKKNLCLVFRPLKPAKLEAYFKPPANSTVIYAQFPALNPNEREVEINVRQTVFTPEKTGINYLRVRGFELRNAATPWAPPTAGQIGIVSAYWCKGWIIESNEISYSTCCGVALGKYSDGWDNRAESAEGYVGTLTRALTNGWNRATVGGHVVRNNHIHHCEQTGVVGSLGCSFSTVTGNIIHDIHVRQLFGGAEMAGIKFHGAIDVVISGNHIYRCGDCSGIWLDWMGQGAQVTGNLMHDNTGILGDLFFEMQHGPILVANNLLLSPRKSFALNSQGIAAVHNLIVGPIENMRGDTRATPFHQPHATALAGMHQDSTQNDSGDDRFYNNLFVAPCSLAALDKSALPCFAGGNVFTKGSQPSKFDAAPLLETDFDAGLKLTWKPDGWYLALREDKAWRDEAKDQLVTTELLGRAKVTGCAYENPDGSPLRINTDYFGHKRSNEHPFPGPFEKVAAGEMGRKVWPK